MWGGASIPPQGWRSEGMFCALLQEVAALWSPPRSLSHCPPDLGHLPPLVPCLSGSLELTQLWAGRSLLSFLNIHLGPGTELSFADASCEASCTDRQKHM